MATATKTLIAEAAAQEFIAHGYASTSLAAIAERLGVTKGALTYHFPAKSDYAAYFLAVVRRTTERAIAQARREYPRDGIRQIFLYFMLMGHWRENNVEQAAGMALFIDQTSPICGSDTMIQFWRDLSIEAFSLYIAEENPKHMATSEEATDMLLITTLGANFYQKHLDQHTEAHKPLRFLRMALRSVGIPHVDEHADAVITRYSGNLRSLY